MSYCRRQISLRKRASCFLGRRSWIDRQRPYSSQWALPLRTSRLRGSFTMRLWVDHSSRQRPKAICRFVETQRKVSCGGSIEHQPSSPIHAASAPCSRSWPQLTRLPPSAKCAHLHDPEPTAPHGRGPRERTCSSFCSAWLHLLKSWSLRSTRDGSNR